MRTFFADVFVPAVVVVLQRHEGVRVVVLNDTRADENPGCQATVASLVRQLAAITGGEIVTRPRGDGYEYFSDLVRDGRAHARESWIDAVDRFARESSLRDAYASCDLVVANLEGTFHHHTVGALALGGALAFAHRMGKRVWAVNGTVDGIDSWLLDAALGPCEHLAVREPRSLRWLAGRGATAAPAADCAFSLEGFFQRGSSADHRAGAALYTPGVLASIPETLDVDAILADLHTLAASGRRPIFLQMGDSEDVVVSGVRANGFAVEHVRHIPWPAFGSYLRQFPLVVSGRYHVLIFAAMAGVPAVALKSNTFKIDGLLELLGDSIPLVSDANDLRACLSRGALPRGVDRSIIRRCQTLARSNFPAGIATTRSAAHAVGVEGLDWIGGRDLPRTIEMLRTDGPIEFRATIETRPTPVSVHGAFASRPAADWTVLLQSAGLLVQVEQERPDGSAVLQVVRGAAPFDRERLLDHCAPWKDWRSIVPTTERPIRVALFGASNFGRASASRLADVPTIERACFVDNDPAKWSQTLDGLPVLPPTPAVLDSVDVVVVTTMHRGAVARQIIDAGYAHKLLVEFDALIATAEAERHRAQRPDAAISA